MSARPPSQSSFDPSMKYMTDEIVNAFQSARLRYIRVDEADENIKAFLPQIEQDPVIQSLASPAMLRPSGRKEVDWLCEKLSKSFLGVAIALLPSHERGDGSERQAEKKPPTIIGTICIGFGGIASELAHHRTAQLGITIARPYQNKGYGREAINWVLDWAFRHAALHTVGITAASYNENGIHLYQDIGFVLEGRHRETIYFNRKWHDELIFGMTEREWERLRSISPS